MLQRLRQVLASKVRPTDDGFVFCFGGHGGATELVGNDNVPTSYQAIINVIDTEPKLQGKPKLVVFDCCQGNAASELGQLQLPKNMILARSTGLRTKAFEQPGVGNVYSKQLAAAIDSHAAAHSVEDLLKLTQGEVHEEKIFTIESHRYPGVRNLREVRTRHHQVAHVNSALGAYHLYLGAAS